MGALGIWHILILLIISGIFLVPYAKILSRAGWSSWFCLLWFLPLVNLIMLWVFAFGDWPALNRKTN
jgi:hypothetical protein